MRYEMMEARRGEMREAREAARAGGPTRRPDASFFRILQANQQPTQHCNIPDPRAFLLYIRTTPQSPLHHIIR